MALIITNSRGTCLKMAHLITPSSSFRSTRAMALSAGNGNLAAVHDDDVITKNRMVICKHESSSLTIRRPLHFECSSMNRFRL